MRKWPDHRPLLHRLLHQPGFQRPKTRAADRHGIAINAGELDHAVVAGPLETDDPIDNDGGAFDRAVFRTM
jgi:hypothetical protein